MTEKQLSSELWNCPSSFQFQCPREWEKLKKSPDPKVRFYAACQQNVHLCRTPAEFVAQGNRGHCVAVPQRTVPAVATRFLMGRIAPSAFERLERERAAAQTFWRSVLKRKPKFESKNIAAIVKQIPDHRRGS